MSLKKEKRQLQMFELNFADLLDSNHELLRAAELIDWDELHEALSVHYSVLGRHGKPIRLMVGIHILKHHYNCSDQRAVEEIHENAYWQCFCGFSCFQRGPIVEPTTLVKFRDRIGVEGMQRIEAVLFKNWRSMGLVKTSRVAADTTAQPKNIAYPTDADLLYRIKERIVKQVKKVRQSLGLTKRFRSFTRVGKKVLMQAKKLYRNHPEKQKQAIKELLSMTNRVVRQAARIGNSLYARGHKSQGRQINQLVSIGRRIVNQSRQVLNGEKPDKRLYSLHEHQVAVIKKGKIHKPCEFGSLVSLMINDDGLVLAHQEYQQNIADSKTVGPVINRMKTNTGKRPDVLAGDRGFDQSYKKQQNCRQRWGVKRLAIPKKGKQPHRDSQNSWFKRALKQRVKIEPIIGHLKTDHRMNRCRYKGPEGDTTNVVWATVAWNVRKTTRLQAIKEQKGAKRKAKTAA
jgi:IS5 family transposase